MDQRFDPYHAWLSIPPKDQPPHHYRLLGLDLFEADSEVIERAADRQRAYLRQHQNGPRARESQLLLNEVSQAVLCLLDPRLKRAYDAELKAKVAKTSSPPPPVKPPLAKAAELPVVAVAPTPTIARKRLATNKGSNQTLLIAIGVAAAAAFLGVVIVLATSGGNGQPVSQKPAFPSVPPKGKTPPEKVFPDNPKRLDTSPTDATDDEPVTVESPPEDKEEPETPEKPDETATDRPSPQTSTPEPEKPEPRGLSSLVDDAAAAAAKEQDRQLWASSHAVFERLPDGAWQSTSVNGRRARLRELSRPRAFVELQTADRKVRLMLHADHADRIPPPANETDDKGKWYTPLALLPLGNAKADIDRAIENYDADLARARKDLDKAFESAMGAVRRRSGKPEEKLAAVKILEADQARFNRNGLVSWALPMRDDSRDYIVSLNKAAKQANEAFDRVIDKLVATGEDDAAESLGVIKRKTIAPHVIATLEATGHFTNRLLSNGHVNRANHTWTWSVDKAGLFATGPHEGEVYVDRYTLSEDGKKFRIKNNKDAQFNGVVLSEPFEP